MGIAHQPWDASLIRTKTMPPRVPSNNVRRNGAFKNLEAQIDRALIIVAAPAGSGKTTLLTAWCDELKIRGDIVAWLSVDEDDNDAFRFSAYLVAAISRPSEELGKRTRALLHEEPRTPQNIVISTLLNDIADYAENVFLVIDDLDRLTSRPILSVVSQLLRYAPQNFHILLGVRSRSFLALGRLRIDDRLFQLDHNDLRFSVDEAVTFFSQAGFHSLSHNDIELLNSATEGWVAGLQLASLALRDSGSTLKVAQDLKQVRFSIDEYLNESVISRLPQPIQQFLLRTAILDRISAGVCDALVGRGARSSEKLEWLQRHNIFLVPLDAEREWFRYHALFSDALRKRVARQLPTELPNLHRHASTWFADMHLWPEAIKHALAAGDSLQATQWIENCGFAMANRREGRALLGWIAALPHEQVQYHQRPSLAKTQARTLLESDGGTIGESQPTGAPPAGINVAMPSPKDSSASSIFPLGVDESRSPSCEGHQSEGEPDSKGIYALTPLDAPRAAEPAHIFGLLYESSVDLKGSHANLAPVWSDSFHANIYADVCREVMFGLAAQVRCKPYDAIPILEKARLLGEANSGPGSVAAALPASYLSWIYYEHDDMSSARKMVANRTAVVMQTCPSGALLRHTCTTARLSWRAHDIDAALSVLDQARRVANARQCSQLRVRCDAEAVRLYLAEGQTDGARRVFEGLRSEIPVMDASQTASNLETLTTYAIMEARLHLADGQWCQATTVLEQLRSRAGTANLWYPDAQSSVLLALALEQSTRHDEAVASIDHALVVARSAGLISTFSDEGKVMRQLLERWKRTTPDATTSGDAFFDRLFAAVSRSELPSLQESEDPVHDNSDLLSYREIEILDLVARSLSNKEIARALRVAPETVKWHLKNIYEKLNVSSRIQAMQRRLELARDPQR